MNLIDYVLNESKEYSFISKRDLYSEESRYFSFILILTIGEKYCP